MQQNKTKNLKTLGKRIKELRLEKSHSLNKFVFSKVGLTTATWSRIENGLVDVKFSTLIKVAAAFDISLSELVKEINIDYNITE